MKNFPSVGSGGNKPRRLLTVFTQTEHRLDNVVDFYTVRFLLFFHFLSILLHMHVRFVCFFFHFVCADIASSFATMWKRIDRLVQQNGWPIKWYLRSFYQTCARI